MALSMSANKGVGLTQLHTSQSFRYLLNGIVATTAHFLVLTFVLKVLLWESAGAANVVAACCGISLSFLGNRYYVFQNSVEPLFKQIYRFFFVYCAAAVGHGLIMYVWADVFKLNYIFGFLLATAFQVVCSYFGNKRMVFKV